MLIILAAAIAVLATWAYQDRRHGRDMPSWLVTVAARWLPTERRDWADALVAELAIVHGRTARWAYAVAALRMVTVPPAHRPPHLARTASIAAIGAVALSTAAILTVPTVAPFITTLAALLAGYVTVRKGRSTPHTATPSSRTVTVIAIVGIAATVAALWAVAVIHPSAATDHTHILSTLLAAVLIGFLGNTLHRPTAHADLIRYGAAAGATCLAGIAALTALAGPDRAAVSPLLSLPGIGVCLIVALAIAVKTGNATAARRAGLLTAILAAPLQFAVATINLLNVHDWSLTTTYDQAAYPRSGYPDVASYMISDALGGYLITGILIGPLILGVIASMAATAGARLRTPSHI
jgi:hypothetical protein